MSQAFPIRAGRWLRSTLHTGRTPRTDTFAIGVALMLVGTGAQRLIGLARSVLICRWLPAEEVGRWELALSFLLLVAPLVVLGIPGSFGRFVGHFRQRNQLRPFLRWATTLTFGLALFGTSVVLVGRNYLADLVFNSADQAWLITALAPCLLAAIAYNYATSLLTALRLHRYQTILQFGHSLLFALLCIGLIAFGGLEAIGVVGAYGGACVLASVAAGFWLWSAVAEDVSEQENREPSAFWSTVVTFAIWTWLGTTVANLFAVVDRYMIVQFSGMSDDVLYAAIGQYHCGRMVPRLLRQLAFAVAAMLIPHMIEAWQERNESPASLQLAKTMKLFVLACTGGSVALLIGAPLLFDVMLDGRYPQARELLPAMLVSCIWFGMAILQQTRLHCADKAWLGMIAFAIGLTINVALNWFLLPLWGLYGAVVATAIANLATLAAMHTFSEMLGMVRLRRIVAWTLVPLALLAPPLMSLAAILLVAAGLVWRGDLVRWPLRRNSTA